MTKSVPIAAASTRFTAQFPGLGRLLTGARQQALAEGNTGDELPRRLRYDVGLSDCREGDKVASENDVSREMMRRSF